LRVAQRAPSAFAMEPVVELAFEVLHVFARLILAALELLIECLRALVKPFLQVVLESVVDVIVEPCGRGWQRLHRWVGHVTGLPWLSIPITILLVMAVIAGAYVSIVVIGRLIF